MREDFSELCVVARTWWDGDDVRFLPGEAGGHTVFEIEFWDGCRFFGCTRESLFQRVASLVDPFGSSAFVVEHAFRVAYVVRCVASGLPEDQALRLRQLLVSQAPVGLARLGGTTLRAETCFQLQALSLERGMPFHEAAAQGLFERDQ